MFRNIVANRKKYLPFILVSLLVGGALLFTNTTPTSSEKTKEITPTLFVHGYKGGPGSFGTMLSRLESQNIGQKSMIARVTRNNKLLISGDISNQTNPFIQVIFENNRASIKSQTAWLQQILRHLHDDYNIENVNLVGHSMGGLSSTNFVLHNQNDHYPNVDKLAVIASPFEGIERDGYFDVNTGRAAVDLQSKSQALKSMVDRKHQFDENTHVLAVAGVINKEKGEKTEEAEILATSNQRYNNREAKQTEVAWDGLVSLPSALGIKTIAPKEHYAQKIFYDTRATHSGLHEHTGVDATLAKFLWNIQSH
ncbi:alpha/beta hydrolase [Thalassobacillus sp. CUG 92003]|uniref:alpha/beta hydrolase n=1 Tax=Thalassobacillus sp. CUG 92003 TaxID=2736641 RepID=UPI0015E63993|nr:alpha/beta hydrolase [Thalassobacillus sp. CUG 92003]